MALEEKSEFTAENIIQQILKFEGGYVNHPSDPGGETNFGITKNTALQYRTLWPKFGFNGDMKQMPISLAIEIYRQGFWNKIRGDELLSVHPMLAFHMFDFAVNSGAERPVTRLQAYLNKVGENGKRWPLLKEDGRIGNMTISVLKACAKEMGENWVNLVLVKDLIDGHENFYRIICKKNTKLNVFLKGWLNRLNHKRGVYQKVFCNK